MNTMNKSSKLPGLNQAGTALIMAMVVLLILTLIGVSALNTTSLEAKMAGNLQDTTRALEAAESGNNQGLATGTFSEALSPPDPEYDFGGTKATVTRIFLERTNPKRNSGFSLESFDGVNFDQMSQGTGLSGGRSTLHQGVQQISSK